MATVNVNGVTAIAGVAIGIILTMIGERTRTLRGRAACLHAARLALDEFYDTAERLLADPAVPDGVKHALYDLTLAVTDKHAGPVAFEAVVDWIEAPKHPPKATGINVELDQLRKARGDLYDDFVSALRSALASLMFAYGPDHSKVVVEFAATRNQSIMLGLMNRLDKALAEWIASGGKQTISAA